MLVSSLYSNCIPDVAVDKYVGSWEQQKAWTGIIMWPTVRLSDNKDGRCWMMKRDMA